MDHLLTAIAIEFPFLVFWLLVLYAMDRRWREKGSDKAIFFMVVAGGASVLPSWASYYINPFYFTYWFGSFAFNFAVVGLAEELIKFLTFILMARVMNSIREPSDGIVQGAAVGIGFTLVENVMYGIWYWPGTTLMRSFLVGFHGLAGALWGFAWAGAVYENAGERQPRAYFRAFMAFIPVALLHGLYNTLADVINDFDALFFVLFVFELVLLSLAVMGFRWMQARSPFYRFPYSDADVALVVIGKGMKRMQRNPVLRRRYGIYAIAAGRYADAAAYLESCLERTNSDAILRAFLAVAVIGLGDHRAGEQRLDEAVSLLSRRRRIQLEGELCRIVRDPTLARRIEAVLHVPFRELDEWEARRDYLRSWNAPRVVHPREGP